MLLIRFVKMTSVHVCACYLFVVLLWDWFVLKWMIRWSVVTCAVHTDSPQPVTCSVHTGSSQPVTFAVHTAAPIVKSIYCNSERTYPT